jgi:hypothetical protein
MSVTAITPDLIAETDHTDFDAPVTPAEETEANPTAETEYQVKFLTGGTRRYRSAETLREHILDGRFPEGSRARAVTLLDGQENPTSEWADMVDFATNHPEFRSAYRPVWDKALTFMGYGTFVGIGLKLLDTTFTMFAIDQAVGILWLIVVGSLILSSRWPLAPLVAIYFTVKAGIGINLFFAALTSGLVGAAFGVPVGLVIGTVVGHLRRNDVRTAPDAPPEGRRPYMLGLAVPAIYLSLAIPAYVWFNMKAVEWLVS